MKSYIEIQRLQTVRIFIGEGRSWEEARQAIRDGKMFDDDYLLSWEGEEVIEEDYSGSDRKYRIYENGSKKADCFNNWVWNIHQVR